MRMPFTMCKLQERFEKATSLYNRRYMDEIWLIWHPGGRGQTEKNNKLLFRNKKKSAW